MFLPQPVIMLCWDLNCTGNRGKADKVIQQIVAKTEAMENEDSVISLYIPTDDNRAMNTQMNVEIWGNAKVNGVICGDVRAEKNLICSKVNGNISAGGNVTCENVNGEVYAGGKVSGF